ncbi:MAG: hypothetical protein V4681_01320 [Patescibacteria group bacterium]
MSFKLVLKGAYSQTIYNFLRGAGIHLQPLNAAHEVSLGEDRLWELSRRVPRFLVESNLESPDEPYIALDVDTTFHEPLNHLYERPVPHLRLHVEDNKCVIREESVAPPGGKPVRVRDVAFWPRTPKENRRLEEFFSPEQQAA